MRLRSRMAFVAVLSVQNIYLDYHFLHEYRVEVWEVSKMDATEVIGPGSWSTHLNSIAVAETFDQLIRQLQGHVTFST